MSICSTLVGSDITPFKKFQLSPQRKKNKNFIITSFWVAHEMVRSVSKIKLA